MQKQEEEHSELEAYFGDGKWKETLRHTKLQKDKKLLWNIAGIVIVLHICWIIVKSLVEGVGLGSIVGIVAAVLFIGAIGISIVGLLMSVVLAIMPFGKYTYDERRTLLFPASVIFIEIILLVFLFFIGI
ncbi:MAG: hypothetical protein AB8F95_01045 [Bacteroidia bacterium]